MQVDCRNIQVGYGESIVIEDMSITIEKDKITSIIGPNGSGKSTVLKAATRLLNYQRGEVIVKGKDIRRFKPKELSRCIGVLAQKHSAPADFRVRETARTVPASGIWLVVAFFPHVHVNAPSVIRLIIGVPPTGIMSGPVALPVTSILHSMPPYLIHPQNQSVQPAIHPT